MSEIFLTPKKGTNIHKCCKALMKFYTSMKWDFHGDGKGVCFEYKKDLSVIIYTDSNPDMCGIGITGSDEQICFYVDEHLGGLDHVAKHFEIEDVHASLGLCDPLHLPLFLIWQLPELEKKRNDYFYSLFGSHNVDAKKLTYDQMSYIKSVLDAIEAYNFELPAFANHESCRGILPNSKTNGISKIKETFGGENNG